jgi:hypothetical protein
MLGEGYNREVVKTGTFLYAGEVLCDIRIVKAAYRYGSGDFQDPSDLHEDLEEVSYYIEYGSTTTRGVYNSGGGAFPSLEEAVQVAENAPGIGQTVRWLD